MITVVEVPERYEGEMEVGDELMPVTNVYVFGGYEYRMTQRVSDGRYFLIPEELLCSESFSSSS